MWVGLNISFNFTLIKIKFYLKNYNIMKKYYFCLLILIFIPLLFAQEKVISNTSLEKVIDPKLYSEKTVFQNVTKVLTTFVKDSPIADFIKRDLRSRGMDYEGKDVEQGDPWGYRHQFNIADSGYGSRGPRVCNDRAGEVGRTLTHGSGRHRYQRRHGRRLRSEECI